MKKQKVFVCVFLILFFLFSIHVLSLKQPSQYFHPYFMYKQERHPSRENDWLKHSEPNDLLITVPVPGTYPTLAQPYYH